MKAILTMTFNKADGGYEEKRLLFDTTKAKKICDVTNTFGNAVQTLYLTPNGIIFSENIPLKKLEVIDQKQAKDYIGEKYPDKYIKFFGEVEEA